MLVGTFNFFLIDMVRRLADMANTQFITTAFQPELVNVADKIYGVTHKNRVSRVNVVSTDDALDFIDHDQSHNEVSFISFACYLLVLEKKKILLIH